MSLVLILMVNLFHKLPIAETVAYAKKILSFCFDMETLCPNTDVLFLLCEFFQWQGYLIITRLLRALELKMTCQILRRWKVSHKPMDFKHCPGQNKVICPPRRFFTLLYESVWSNSYQPYTASLALLTRDHVMFPLQLDQANILGKKHTMIRVSWGSARSKWNTQSFLLDLINTLVIWKKQLMMTCLCLSPLRLRRAMVDNAVSPDFCGWSGQGVWATTRYILSLISTNNSYQSIKRSHLIIYNLWKSVWEIGFGTQNRTIFCGSFNLFFKHFRFVLNLTNSWSVIPLVCFQYDTICLPAFILRTRSRLQEAWRLSIEPISRVQLQLEAHYLLQATSNQAHKYLNHLCLSHIYPFSPLLSALVAKKSFANLNLTSPGHYLALVSNCFPEAGFDYKNTLVILKIFLVPSVFGKNDAFPQSIVLCLELITRCSKLETLRTIVFNKSMLF